MAWTTSKKYEFSPGGNHMMQLWELTADSATVELDTGLGTVDHVQLTKASGAASAASFQEAIYTNADSAASSNNGMISITGVTSGADFFLTVWGH